MFEPLELFDRLEQRAALGTLGTESDPALGGLSWYRLGDNRRKRLLEISTNSVAVTTKMAQFVHVLKDLLWSTPLS